MTPLESMDWLRDRVIPEYPVGVLTDHTEIRR